MADSITIKVSELYDLVKKMKDDRMDFVELLILDEEEDETDSSIIPRTLSFSATAKKSSFSTDYDCIDETTID